VAGRLERSPGQRRIGRRLGFGQQVRHRLALPLVSAQLDGAGRNSGAAPIRPVAPGPRRQPELRLRTQPEDAAVAPMSPQAPVAPAASPIMRAWRGGACGRVRVVSREPEARRRLRLALDALHQRSPPPCVAGAFARIDDWRGVWSGLSDAEADQPSRDGGSCRRSHAFVNRATKDLEVGGHVEIGAVNLRLRLPLPAADSSPKALRYRLARPWSARSSTQ